jgi:asparagine synthase (glutamine-hydrolysing)
MSVQFGKWNIEGKTLGPDYLKWIRGALAPYGPDSDEVYANSDVTILYRAFHTTTEAPKEVQPYISNSGIVLTWDGRLDNRAELIRELSAHPNSHEDLPDAELVAAAVDRWGEECLGKLIGDWALSVWDPRRQSLLLAKDPLGTRHLYYTFSSNHVMWCTILDPLVLDAGASFNICEEYVAGWFATLFPAAHLTPYEDIHAVAPSSAVTFDSRRFGVERTIHQYWDFDPAKWVRYRTDAAYEEHFRKVLCQAVQRRLRSNRPVLAELSGGMDSSSIVCLSDRVRETGGADQLARVDTISWFDDSYDDIEPDTNELHWIRKVEEKRGRPGFHIAIAALKKDVLDRPLFSELQSDLFLATPAFPFFRSEFSRRYGEYVEQCGYRVRLSGIGGDEPTGGGVPAPTTELQDLVTQFRLLRLVRQLNAWAAKMKTTRWPLLWTALQGFSANHIDVPKDLRPGWLRKSFMRQNWRPLHGYPTRVRFWGALPSFQNHLESLDGNRRYLASVPLVSDPLTEARYPYFDRDFLEFMFAIPREQIVRIGQRRSLMKRALADIVPRELLTRKRKPFTFSHAGDYPPLAARSELEPQMAANSHGIVDQSGFFEALESARTGQSGSIEALRRLLTLESWLRYTAQKGIWKGVVATSNHSHSPSTREGNRVVVLR